MDVARGLSRRRAGRIRVGVWNEFRLLVIKQVPAARTRGEVPWCVMASPHGGGEIGNSVSSMGVRHRLVRCETAWCGGAGPALWEPGRRAEDGCDAGRYMGAVAPVGGDAPVGAVGGAGGLHPSTGEATVRGSRHADGHGRGDAGRVDLSALLTHVCSLLCLSAQVGVCDNDHGLRRGRRLSGAACGDVTWASGSGLAHRSSREPWSARGYLAAASAARCCASASTS